jgi:rSAM/selenodomain-associated transferase 1
MADSRQHTAVALFVRHPVPGRVKTRLACDLGPVDACHLYRAIVSDVLAALGACGLPLYLFHDGQNAAGLPPEWVAAAEETLPQAGASLGKRMSAAFEYLFSIGRQQVILVGSDIPGIDAPLLQSAVAALAEHDVIISPAFDGGYCLVASSLGRFNDAIFHAIPWSSSRVLDKTLETCMALRLSYTLLDTRQDIDTLDDVESYCRQPSFYALSTNRWLTARGFMASACNDSLS